MKQSTRAKRVSMGLIAGQSRSAFPLGNIAVTLMLLAPGGLSALPADFTKAAVATGLDVSFICALKDGRVLVNEKHGAVRVIKDDKLLDTPMLNITSQVNNANERGLLGITVD